MSDRRRSVYPDVLNEKRRLLLENYERNGWNTSMINQCYGEITDYLEYRLDPLDMVKVNRYYDNVEFLMGLSHTDENETTPEPYTPPHFRDNRISFSVLPFRALRRRGRRAISRAADAAEEALLDDIPRQCRKALDKVAESKDMVKAKLENARARIFGLRR
jgi:hypothetical protein